MYRRRIVVYYAYEVSVIQSEQTDNNLYLVFSVTFSNRRRRRLLLHRNLYPGYLSSSKNAF